MVYGWVMSTLDWIILALLAPMLLAPALFARGKRSESAAERFAGSRGVPWFVLGGSLAATSLSTDTPLLVAGAFYDDGLSGNWFWLAGIPGSLATLFFFARYWRRAGVLTEFEILSVRYGTSPSVKWLRAVSAVFDAGLLNLLVLASITVGASLLAQRLFGLSDDALLTVGTLSITAADLISGGLLAIALSYTLAAGFRAVVGTDLAQLTAAIGASVVVAYFAIGEAIVDYGTVNRAVEAIPDAKALFSLFALDQPLIYLLLVFRWWQAAPGGGLFVQRLIAARSETDATLTAFLFIILHYVVRVWPWFAIGALALVYFPNLPNSELAYPAMTERFLPVGAIGLLAVALMAAFMSTADSRLNWAASYFVNDVFAVTGHNRDGRTARFVEFVVVIGLAIAAFGLAISGLFDSIIGIYKYLIVIQSGAAFVAIARWYWWRITIEAEIVSLLASVGLGNAIVLLIDISGTDGFAVAVAVNSTLTAIVALITAVLTSQAGPTAASVAFHRLTQVGGPGWRRIAATKPAGSRGLFLRSFLGWLASTALIYALISLIAGLIVQNGLQIATSGGVLLVAMSALWMLRASLKDVFGLGYAETP